MSAKRSVSIGIGKVENGSIVGIAFGNCDVKLEAPALAKLTSFAEQKKGGKSPADAVPTPYFTEAPLPEHVARAVLAVRMIQLLQGRLAFKPHHVEFMVIRLPCYEAF